MSRALSRNKGDDRIKRISEPMMSNVRFRKRSARVSSVLAEAKMSASPNIRYSLVTSTISLISGVKRMFLPRP